MSTLLGLFAETPAAAAQPRVASVREEIREQSQRMAVASATPVHEEQIQTLVQQLFFRHESGPLRHVGFAAVESSTATATLCLEVAQALAEDGRDVGLIDANPDGILLPSQLQIPSPNRGEANWPIAPRLWMVPRQSWLGEGSGRRITDQNLSRLRELTAEFDFSVLWCAPVTWLTASIGRSCDGLVLVLTANKTRRLVAAQIKDQLSKAKVSLLGTVLSERRFPVPQGLYRSL